MCMSMFGMWNSRSCLKLIIILLLHFLIFAAAANAGETDQTSVPAVEVQNIPDVSIKCGECPCVNPCSQQLTPPPPPLPPPPPPSNTNYCPPVQTTTTPTPPPPRFMYYTGLPAEQSSVPPPPRFSFVTGQQPGSVYQTDPYDLQGYSRATRNCIHHQGLPPMILFLEFGLLQMLVSWGS